MTDDGIRAVVVTYNSEHEIGGCLDALTHASEKYRLDVTVVDNGSSDGTLRILHEQHPSVQVIASTNLGYAHGCNLAVREVLENGRDCKAILILNPDATLCAGAIDQLAEVLFSAPDTGGVSPHVVERSGGENLRLRTLMGSSMIDEPLAGHNVAVTDRLHGCCMLLRPEVFQRIGFLDEHYFLYWEELDFGLRAIASGFKLLLCSDVVVYHRCDSQERRHRIYYMWRNQFRFARNRYAAVPRLIFLSRRALGAVKELANFIRIKRFDLVGAAMAGLWAGLRGETGKSSSRYAEPASAD